MILQVFADLYPFLVVFMTFCLVNTFFIDMMKGEFDQGDYPQIPKTFMVTFLQVFRNSIGDLAIIGYGPWVPVKEEGAEDDPELPLTGAITICILWGIWFINVFVMQIVLLNFLIAEVSATYSKVRDGGT